MSREEIKNQILSAAEARFTQYGFNKTTMNEIAGDCNMSAANIYRFFKSKSDIAAEMAKRFFAETENTLRASVRDPGMTPVECLEAFALEVLQIKHNHFANQANLNELVEFISEKQLELLERHEEVMRSLIAEVLAEGNRIGKFDINDIVTAADVFLKATILLYCPYFMHLYTLEQLEYYAKEIVRMLVKGLEKR